MTPGRDRSRLDWVFLLPRLSAPWQAAFASPFSFPSSRPPLAAQLSKRFTDFGICFLYPFFGSVHCGFGALRQTPGTIAVGTGARWCIWLTDVRSLTSKGFKKLNLNFVSGDTLLTQLLTIVCGSFLFTYLRYRLAFTGLELICGRMCGRLMNGQRKLRETAGWMKYGGNRMIDWGGGVMCCLLAVRDGEEWEEGPSGVGLCVRRRMLGSRPRVAAQEKRASLQGRRVTLLCPRGELTGKPEVWGLQAKRIDVAAESVGLSGDA